MLFINVVKRVVIKPISRKTVSRETQNQESSLNEEVTIMRDEKRGTDSKT